jgi:glycosyltransferase involved in cell wall biosynthesis
MKIVHVCTAPTGAAYRLHTGLRRLGVDSRLFSVDMGGRSKDPFVTRFRPSGRLSARFRRRIVRARIEKEFARYRATRPALSGRFYDDRSPHSGDALAQLPPCDVIHLHTMTHLIDFRIFFSKVPGRTPVVRTLHDMSFFTGGCHQDWGCGRFRERCGACPQLGSRDERDLSRRIWQRKHTALSSVVRGRLRVVAPSRWMAEMARGSSLLHDVPITTIPLGIDTEKFRPRDRRLARDIWEIPQDARAMLFVASPLDRPEKGFGLLARALDGFNSPSDFLLIAVGSGELPTPIGIPSRHLGHVSQESVMSTVYSAADVVVVPSVQDTMPQACIEALACGIPVVGFDVGGIPEIVRPGVTGALVPARDVDALRSAVLDLLGDPAKRARLGADCRRVALEEYRLEIQARRYKTLYEEILAGAEAPNPDTAGGTQGSSQRFSESGAEIGAKRGDNPGKRACE